MTCDDMADEDTHSYCFLFLIDVKAVVEERKTLAIASGQLDNISVYCLYLFICHLHSLSLLSTFSTSQVKTFKKKSPTHKWP